MSTTSPQAEAAGEQEAWQAQLSQMLSGISMPEIQQLTGKLSGMLGSRNAAGQLAPDVAIKSAAQGQLNTSYDQAIRGSREAIQYGALRSGLSRTSPGAVGSATMSAATSLDRDRMSALRNLEFQSAQSSLNDYNQVLGLLGQGTKQSLGLAGGFGGAAGSAIAGLSNQTQMGGILGGAASGASLGATVGGGWGALAGGVVGGAAGALGYGG